MTDRRPHQSRPPADAGWVAPAVLLALVVVAAGWALPRTALSNWVVCPFWALSGIDCPGCGMTRSIGALLGGDLTASISYHAGGPLLVGGLGWVAGLRIGDRIAGRRLLASWRRRFDDASTAFWTAVLVAVLVYWIARLAFGI